MQDFTAEHRKDFADAYTLLADATPFESFRPNPGGQELFFASDAHELIFAGGNSSGKTYCGVVMCGYHILPEIDIHGNKTGKTLHPHLDLRIRSGGRHGWISTFSQETQRDTIQENFDKLLGPYTEHVYMEKDVYRHALFPDGGTIGFKWQKQGKSGYRGAKKDFIYCDEPHEEAIYNEAKMRTVRTDGYIWTCMTPVIDPSSPLASKDVLWMKDKLVDPWLREPEKFPLREIIMVDVEENKRYVNIDFILSTLQGMSAEEYQIRKSGLWVDFGGRACFNREMLNELEIYLQDTDEAHPEYGHLEYDQMRNEDWKVVFIDSRRDFFPVKPEAEWIIKIWEHPVPDSGIQRRPEYFIAADVAEGVAGGDFTSVYVARGDTRRVVAALHGHLTELELAKQLNLLGQYYGTGSPAYKNARLAIEVRNFGKTTINFLITGQPEYGVQKYGMDRLYHMPNKADLQRGIVFGAKPGWDTNSSTRGYVIGAMRRALLDALRTAQNPEMLCSMPDLGIIREGKAFLMSKRGKYEALIGENDDRLFSLGILRLMMDCYLGESDSVDDDLDLPDVADDEHYYYDKEGNVRFNFFGAWKQASKKAKSKDMFF